MKLVLFILVVIAAFGKENLETPKWIEDVSKGFIAGIAADNTNNQCKAQVEMIPAIFKEFNSYIHSKERKRDDLVYLIKLAGQNIFEIGVQCELMTLFLHLFKLRNPITLFWTLGKFIIFKFGDLFTAEFMLIKSILYKNFYMFGFALGKNLSLLLDWNIK